MTSRCVDVVERQGANPIFPRLVEAVSSCCFNFVTSYCEIVFPSCSCCLRHLVPYVACLVSSGSL